MTIGQGLLDSGWLEPVPNTREGRAVFKDEYILYQPGLVRNSFHFRYSLTFHKWVISQNLKIQWSLTGSGHL